MPEDLSIHAKKLLGIGVAVSLTVAVGATVLWLANYGISYSQNASLLKTNG
jgi:hypothetical protein